MENYLESEDFPFLLNQIADKPKGIYCYGKREFLDTKCISIVGSRKPDQQTKRVLRLIVPKLVELGYTIVSGCAQGVDAYAHELALMHGGRCIGVLGYGNDTRYPKSSHGLIERLCQIGLIITEYEATTPIRKFQFIARNRLIAALSQTTILVQAGEKSGSLITAQMALDYSRDVFVVPGSAFDTGFYGSHMLIEEGAQILYTLEQFEKKSGLF